MADDIKKWTGEEEVIFLEAMEKICGASLWQEIKSAGRLAHRGNAGIRAHYIALVSSGLFSVMLYG